MIMRLFYKKNPLAIVNIELLLWSWVTAWGLGSPPPLLCPDSQKEGQLSFMCCWLLHRVM